MKSFINYLKENKSPLQAAQCLLMKQNDIEYDVLCVVGGEMYEPFIYLTWFGHIMCLMMVFLEPKWYKKKIKK